MNEITIIGESPEKKYEAAPLTSLSYGRICGLLELKDISELTKLARVVTLLGFHPEGSFPLRAASVAARSLELSSANILLGSRVAACFGLYSATEPLEWYVLPGGEEVVLFPHPSPHNRWWGDPKKTKKAKDFIWDIFWEQEDVEGEAFAS